MGNSLSSSLGILMATSMFCLDLVGSRGLETQKQTKVDIRINEVGKLKTSRGHQMKSREPSLQPYTQRHVTPPGTIVKGMVNVT